MLVHTNASASPGSTTSAPAARTTSANHGRTSTGATAIRVIPGTYATCD